MKVLMKKGFTVIELLLVIAMIAILTGIIVAKLGNAQAHAKNAAIVSALAGVNAAIDASKYPNSLEDLCLDFEPGGELASIRASVERNGGIWYCDSTVGDYRIFAKLNLGVVVASNSIVKSVYAQEESNIHQFGNYYCANSDFDNNFTHWSGENLLYPSCSDDDYTGVIQDPSENPDPTPDPDPESDPDPPLEDGGSICGGKKQEVCHFGKTLCISSKAVKAHLKHGDKEGSC